MFFRFFYNENKHNLQYSAIDIANYVVNKCSSDNIPISNLQLQKILYYLQLHFLKNEHSILFSDEIEAWPFGPVVRKVYYKFCGFGSMPIYELTDDSIEFEPEVKNAIDEIVEEKRAQNPWALVEETHAIGKAWDLIYKNGQGSKTIIPKEVIANYG